MDVDRARWGLSDEELKALEDDDIKEEEEPTPQE